MVIFFSLTKTAQNSKIVSSSDLQQPEQFFSPLLVLLTIIQIYYVSIHSIIKHIYKDKLVLGENVWCTFNAFSTRQRMALFFQLDKNNSKHYKIIFYIGLKPTPGHAQRLICPGILLKQCTTTCENLVQSVFDIGFLNGTRNQNRVPNTDLQQPERFCSYVFVLLTIYRYIKCLLITNLHK